MYKKILLISLLLLFVFPILFLFIKTTYTQEKFQQFSEELFKNELTADTLSMHYTAAYPENFGIEDYSVTLPDYSLKNELASNVSLENYNASLSSIDVSYLNNDDAFAYELLSSFLQQKLEGQKYSLLSEPLSPSSGVASQLPVLLSEYTFRNKTDVENYLSLLSQIDGLFQDVLQYESKKAEEGYFMTNYACDELVRMCNDFVKSDFLSVTFSERINDLIQADIISTADADIFLAENERLLSQAVYPSYRSLASELLLLKPYSKNQEGLAHVKDGKDYYTYYLKQNTGSHKTVDELKVLLTNQLRTLFTQASTISSSSLPSKMPAFELTTPEEMIIDLQTQMERDFPAFPDNMENNIICNIKAVDASLENYTAPAFYLTPPIDDVTNNSIYINYKSSPEGLNLYTTLAHEGYPGHLFQSVYFQLQLSPDSSSSYIRPILNYGGYVEGYALYVELLSYQYAANLAKDADSLYELYALDRSLQLCIYSLLDIAIHYDGISLADATAWLQNLGITDTALCAEIYNYIVTEPTNYLKYYIGYLEIMELQKNAKLLWQEEYTPIRFHTFLLNIGPAPFPFIEEQLYKTCTDIVPTGLISENTH